MWYLSCEVRVLFRIAFFVPHGGYIIIICQTFAHAAASESRVSQRLRVDVGCSARVCRTRVSVWSEYQIAICANDKIPNVVEDSEDLPLQRDRRRGQCESCAAAEFYIVAIVSTRR